MSTFLSRFLVPIFRLILPLQLLVRYKLFIFGSQRYIEYDISEKWKILPICSISRFQSIRRSLSLLYTLKQTIRRVFLGLSHLGLLPRYTLIYSRKDSKSYIYFRSPEKKSRYGVQQTSVTLIISWLTIPLLYDRIWGPGGLLTMTSILTIDYSFLINQMTTIHGVLKTTTTTTTTVLKVFGENNQQSPFRRNYSF